MRTDAKIGFAIGGVLLAVLTVYAIVVPRHNKRSANTVSLVVTPPAPSSDNSTTPPPPIAAADSATPTLPPSPAPVSPIKDVTPAPVAPYIGPPPVADNSVTPPDGFHPLVTADIASQASDQRTSKLIDGVYTPARKVAKIKHANPLPDEADASSANDTLYTIKPGQTLSKIAYEVYGNSRFWVVIQRENKGLDSKHLKVGTKVRLPDISTVVPGPVTVSDEEVAPMASASTAMVSRRTAEISTDGHTYTVKSGDSLYGIAKHLLGSGRKAEALYALNKDVIGPDKSRLKLGMVLKLPE